MPHEHYDKLETRDPEERERDLFGRLPDLIALALSAPGWARQLAEVDPNTITSRAALARLPVLRKSDLLTLQKEHPPFGGFNVAAPGRARRLLMSPGPIFEPEGEGRDWWGAARALFAAGFRAGDVVHNSFAYHLTPGGFIMESGAHALGCAVVPAGTGNSEQQVEAIAHLRPAGYLGTPDFLKVLLDTAANAGKDVSSLKRGLVSGAALPPSLRQELSQRGVKVLQCYATAELGVIAYESEALEGMIVNETLLLEIVRPGTDDPVADGEVGEIVVTSFNPDYPMIRLATGDLSAVLTSEASGQRGHSIGARAGHSPEAGSSARAVLTSEASGQRGHSISARAIPDGKSPCGRSNMRIKGWMGRADQTTKVKGMFVHPAQVAEVGRRHPELGRLRLTVTRDGEQDVMVLKAECAAPAAALGDAVAATLQSVTKLRGAVELVAPASLPNDGKVIADERPVG